MMTRKEAKDFKWFQQDRIGIYKHIDRIYEEFKNRTCENCKHKYVVSNDCVECRCNDSMIDFLDLECFPEFGCNKWEKGK